MSDGSESRPTEDTDAEHGNPSDASNVPSSAPTPSDAPRADPPREAGPDARLTMICTMVDTQLPGARCAVLRIDPSTATLHVEAAPRLPETYVRAVNGVAVDEGTCAYAAAVRRDDLWVVDDIADPAGDDAFRDEALAAGIQACWSLPLRLQGGRAWGVLAVHHDTPRAPSRDELAIVRAAAGLAESALGHDAEAAVLRQSERYARTMAEFRRSVMSLVELGLDEGEPGAFDQRLLEEAVRVIPGAATATILKRAHDGAFRFSAVVGFDLERLRTVRIPPEAVSFGTSSRDGRPFVVRHPRLHEALDPPDAATLADEGRFEELRAVLNVPIVVGDEMTAYLTLDNYEDPDAFGEDELEMARIFGGQVASLMRRFELERSLYLQAYEDTLTGLPNRAAFKDHLQKRLDAGRTYPAHAVLFVDLDNLKPINDSLGHPAGDTVLREVARRIQRSVKHDDGFVARLGGDEFTVLLSGPGIGDDAVATARRIIDALQLPIEVESYDVRVGASIGISLCPHDGRTLSDLLRHADIAMYHAKKAGKGTFRFFADEMEAGAQQRMMLEGALRDALHEDQFEVHYQPRVSLQTGRIVAAEALVRWNHPQWGLVEPARFVSLAEATNLIHPLGRRVLELACAEAAGWPGIDGAMPPRVSVNVSRHQLQRADIVEEVNDVLAATGLPADRLELEILETSAMSDVTESARTLARLRALGVHISLDDFGTGHSSLGWLQTLPVDVLKLDRTFVARLGVDGASRTSGADDAAILGAILGLGKALQLTVVAEGIEREAQLAVLERLGCDEGQGFLFSHPLPAHELRPALDTGTVTFDPTN